MADYVRSWPIVHLLLERSFLSSLLCGCFSVRELITFSAAKPDATFATSSTG